MGACIPSGGAEPPLVAVASSPELDPLAQQIEGLGTEVVRYPHAGEVAGRIPLEQWLGALVDGEFDDIVFSTAQGVNLIVEVARQLHREAALLRALSVVRRVARGSHTARALTALGLSAQITSPERTLTSLLETFDAIEFQNRTVGVQPCDPATETALTEALEARGANVLRVAPTSAADPKALEALATFSNQHLSAVVFATKAHTCWLFDALTVSGHEAAFRAALARVTVVASYGAAEFLRERSIPANHILGFAQLSHPLAVDILEALQLSARTPRATIETEGTSDVERNIVVVGNGMVGHQFCRALAEREALGGYTLAVFGEEPHPAYDRVALSQCFTGADESCLELSSRDWYAAQGIELYTGERVVAVDRHHHTVTSSNGRVVRYDKLVFATGSTPLVPPIPGMDKAGVFVYRTLDDMRAIRKYGRSATTCAVLGAGLVGLEAAKACVDMGLATHLLEAEPRLMPRQLDERGAEFLKQRVEELGIVVHLNTNTGSVLGEHRVRGLRFSKGERLDVDMLIVTAGIRPRDELARACGLALARRGGILVDEHLQTSDPRVFAIGECAIFRGVLFGLTTPGFEMASVLASYLTGSNSTFRGADLSTRLQLTGIDVASLGDPFADRATKRSIVFEDHLRGIYKKLVLSEDGSRLMGGILVGDCHQYDRFLGLFRNRQRLHVDPGRLVLEPARTAPLSGTPAQRPTLETCIGRAPASTACTARPDAAE